MTDRVTSTIEGRLGTVTLDRPDAINALDLEMVEAITAALLAFRENEAIGAVLFEGRGARGFCAGGDVRAVREQVLAGRHAEAEAFFAAEYRMNGLISRYPKPVAVLAHGAVMGGGIGIAGHAQFRFAATSSRYAMPEGAIGFFPDVGANWLLARTPFARAVLFTMLGAPVGAADALALGLADCAVDAGDMEAIRDELITAGAAPEPATAIVGVMQSHSIVAGTASFCALADRLAPLLSRDSAAGVVAAVAEAAASEPDLVPIAETLAARSPTSLEIALETQRTARRAGDIEAVLAADLRLARWVIGQPDFAEGVRAVLVDKDRAPRWRPETVDAARIETVKQLVSGAGQRSQATPAGIS